MHVREHGRRLGTEGGRGTGCSFEHTYLVTATAGELARAVVPAVRRSLAAGESVHFILDPRRQAAVRVALGDDADRVSWSDATVWMPHPARRLLAIENLVDDWLGPGLERVWLLVECPWDGDAPELIAEWERFEAVLNATFADRPVTMVCVYDAGDLPAEVVRRAGCSHPLHGLTPLASCPAYVEPASFLAARRAHRLPVPGSAVRLLGPLGPARARAQLASLLGGRSPGQPVVPASCGAGERVRPTAGGERSTPPEAADVLLVGATELVTNSWRAGAGTIEVAWWRDGPWVLVQVDDDGPGLTDPLAGYRRPPVDAPGGRGLWITRQLVDGVDIAAGRWGSSVRLRVRAAVARSGGR